MWEQAPNERKDLTDLGIVRASKGPEMIYRDRGRVMQGK